ncbi:nitrate ABC transporter ATP-binding protein [Microcoleus sp. FACHB-672]|uniref:nitrate ABC transporter ATP-binding protein n=1 Tax=Microcoleus sp. FACHB-672 TaxID=2692825 RepID=UPI0016843AD4|nr:nitrate ABC transporter ATP-binding protein [Microcoleus sp. FACHB-672]MBD2043427.1 ATP-binding cassette domain-containing protein [Microcoleus sp. FACHB-672]
MQSLSSSSLTQTSQLSPESSNREPFLVIENVSKIYPTPKGPYSVVENVNLTVHEGEFVCLIGHSGCGKSTLLNMVAGFLKPSEGEVKLRGSLITKPGPDRMMVFQNYSLLPWKTAFENVALGVKSAYPDKSKAERAAIVEEHLALVGLTESANKRPSQLSGGMKQRVAIARALAIRPQVLILDEPFGALDAITKEELQEELLQIWREFGVTILMITHDIDEALFLADRLVMMTNGPAANIGEVLEIPFARPRNRASIMEDPRYYDLRNHALDFLFNKFAHTEEEPAAQSQPVTSKPASKALALKASAALGLTTVAAVAGLSLMRSLSTSKSANQMPPAQPVATSPTPVATPTQSVVSATPEVKNLAITDAAELANLKQKLYDQIDQNWQQIPTFQENLVYSVKVKKDGEIVSYESVNQAAKDYLQETPFPTLVKSTENKAGGTPQEPFAQYKVVLNPAGMLEVNSQ